MKILISNPWPNNILQMPNDFYHLCSYDLWIGIDSIIENAFYRSCSNIHELWLISGMDKYSNAEEIVNNINSKGMFCSDLALKIESEDNDTMSASEILKGLFIIRARFDRPTTILLEGSIDAELFKKMLDEIYK